jgi:hypothetical protein
MGGVSEPLGGSAARRSLGRIVFSGAETHTGIPRNAISIRRSKVFVSVPILGDAHRRASCARF